MIEGFRRRGIYPANINSLADEALLWEVPDRIPQLPAKDDRIIKWIVGNTESVSRQARRTRETTTNGYEESPEDALADANTLAEETGSGKHPVDTTTASPQPLPHRSIPRSTARP